MEKILKEFEKIYCWFLFDLSDFLFSAVCFVVYHALNCSGGLKMAKYQSKFCFEVSNAINIPIRANGFETNDIGLSYGALVNGF